MYELKPCPFCGGKAVFSCSSHGSKGDMHTTGYRIECLGCKIYTKSVEVTYGYNVEKGLWAETKDLDILVSKWNTRIGEDLCTTEK